MDANELRARAAEIQWWHDDMDLGQGVATKGRSYVKLHLLPYIDLPDDLTGKSVLDIGAWDGFMSFECERRGAARVVAVDSFVWQRPPGPVVWPHVGRDGFDLAHEALGSKVEPVECEVLDLAPDRIGTFDVVLFLGVLYHMRHPLLALEKAAAMVGDNGLLILETHSDANNADVPLMRFYPGDELVGDPTNWWGPNLACLEAMLRDVGFSNVRHVSTLHHRVMLHAWR